MCMRQFILTQDYTASAYTASPGVYLHNQKKDKTVEIGSLE